MNHSDIIVTNVTKIFPVGFNRMRLAVDNLTFSLPAGEVVGLLGPNGSGKSTTLKMILGFLKPTDGEIVICGKSSLEKAARNFIGYLPENPRFQRFLTGKEILHYYGSLLDLPRKVLNKRCEELLNLVGLTHAAQERVQGYSKGMVQRLAIAQALLNQPKIIILDEPMSGLDPLGRIEIRNLITQIHQEMPESTLFFSSHVLEDIEQLCSTVALLQKGKLKAFCQIKELLKQETQCFDITLDRLPENLKTRLLKGVEGRKNSLGITFTAESTSELKEDLDLLLQEGIQVLNINMHRRKLEEALFKENDLVLPISNENRPKGAA